MKVLIVRAVEDAARTSRRLASLGREAAISPALEIHAKRYVIPDRGFDALVATSAHAFTSWSASDAERFATTPLFVVGARTAEAARGAGLAPTGPAAPSAAALAGVLAGAVPSGAAILYLAGRDRKPDLERALAAYQLTVVEIYAAEPAQRLSLDVANGLANGEIGAALHYSRRSAEILLKLVALAGVETAFGRLLHIAISADAAAPLVAAGLNPVVANSPDEEAMIAALESKEGNA